MSGMVELIRFCGVPRTLNSGDPAWVPPLRLERLLHLSRWNPWCAHAEWQGWTAYRNGQPVGRISAQIDRLHRERHGPGTGHFGFLDGVDDAVVFAALFAAAEDWLRKHSVEVVTGPFNFSINHDCGVLVEGFDTPPVLMMPHNRPWYGARVEEQGYRPVRDMLAYWVNVDFDPPAAMSLLLKRYGPKINVRPLRRDHFDEELESIRDIFNDAWSQNWGFVPFTREEFHELGQVLRLLVPVDFIQIAELDHRPVAFIVGLPNLNEVLRELDGSLLPFGWWRVRRALRQKSIRTGRVPLMGVRRELQASPMGIALAYIVIEALRQSFHAHGIRAAEMSWILEDNRGMRSILDSIGSRIYKRYRVYEKNLAAPARALPGGGT